MQEELNAHLSGQTNVGEQAELSLRIDNWVDQIYNDGMSANAQVDMVELDPFKPYIYAFQSFCVNQFAQFKVDGHDTFYAYFQPCFNKVAPLLVHTPGYGGEMSMHPELANQFNVLHINPLGYSTPSGKNMSKLTMNGLGTVLPDTVITKGEGGYKTWLTECVIAVKWAMSQTNVLNRVSFFGTSQGGGASLLLGSIFSGRGTCAVCADQPFMTNFKLAGARGAYAMGDSLIKGLPQKQIDEALALIDTINHVHRYKYPILLNSGGMDVACPIETIDSLFKVLTGTKARTHFQNISHGYNREFIAVANAWFNIFA